MAEDLYSFGGNANSLLKNSCKVLRVLETKLIRNLGDRFVGKQNLLFTKAYYLVLDILPCCFACLFLYKVSKILRGDAFDRSIMLIKGCSVSTPSLSLYS